MKISYQTRETQQEQDYSWYKDDAPWIKKLASCEKSMDSVTAFFVQKGAEVSLAVWNLPTPRHDEMGRGIRAYIIFQSETDVEANCLRNGMSLLLQQPKEQLRRQADFPRHSGKVREISELVEKTCHDYSSAHGEINVEGLIKGLEEIVGNSDLTASKENEGSLPAAIYPLDEGIKTRAAQLLYGKQDEGIAVCMGNRPSVNETQSELKKLIPNGKYYLFSSLVEEQRDWPEEKPTQTVSPRIGTGILERGKEYVKKKPYRCAIIILGLIVLIALAITALREPDPPAAPEESQSPISSSSISPAP
jgi:hypothetical protein